MNKTLIKSLTLYLITVLLVFLVIQKPLFLLYNWNHGTSALAFSDIIDIYVHGLRLDFAMACYLTALPLLVGAVHCYWRKLPFVKIWKAYNAIIAIVIALIILADASMYEFWEFKLDSTVFMYINDPKNATASVSAMYVIVRFVAWLVLAALFYWLLSLPVRLHKTPKGKRQWWGIAGYVLCAGLLFAGMRGLTVWPNNPSVAFYTTRMYCNHSAVNPVFNMMYSMLRRQDFSKEFHVMDDAEANETILPLFPTTGATVDTLLNTNRPDIVVIVTEGMGACFVESLTGKSKQSVAVCLDSLTREGVNFTHCYASSFRTDRGIVCAVSGYPGQPTNSIMRYSSKVRNLPGLPAELKKVGYDTQVLYSSDVTFFNMSNYFVCTGHDRIISQDDFPSSDRITKWGVPDHIAFEWLYNDLVKKHADGVKPHYTTMLTVSSHTPFDVPDFTRYEDPHLNSFAYTDSCIGRFVREIEKTPVWKNLLIVITADHGYNHRQPVASPGFSHIPFIMLGGAIKEPRQIETIMCQTDLPATLLGQLGLPHETFNFSRDVLADSYKEPIAFNAFNNGVTIFDTTGCTVYDNVAQKAVYGDDEKRIKRGKAFLQVLYNDLDKR